MATPTLVLLVGFAAVFLAMLLGLAAIGVLTNEASGVSKSLAVVKAFTNAPAAMRDELDPSFRDRVLTPLVDRFSGLGKKLTASGYTDRIRHRLDVAGNPPAWTVDRVASLKFLGLLCVPVLALAVCALLGVGLTPMIGVGLAAALAGYMAPNIYLYQRGAERTQSLQKELPDALDLLTISVEAGLGFNAALAQVAKNTDGPLSEEFARVLQEMQLGLGRAEALRALGERSTLPDLRSFASAMVQADVFGIPVGKVLRVQALEIRTKRRQSAEEKAQKVAVKLMIPLILCILPRLFIVVLGPAAIGMAEAFK